MLKGICIRTGVYITMNIISMIWKSLTDTPLNKDDINEQNQGIIKQVSLLRDIESEK